MRFKFLKKMLATVLAILLVFPISSLAFADAEINTSSDVTTEETTQQLEVAELIPLTVEENEEVVDVTSEESEKGIQNSVETTIAPLSMETPKTAFAIYSDDDKSLNFYKREEVPSVGETFEGKTVTNVYTGFETKSYDFSDLIWKSNSYETISVTVVDEGIQPISTSYWFYSFLKATSFDLSKLDTSNVASMHGMFSWCSSLTDLDLSSWDTSKVTSTGMMFEYCRSLINLDLSNWNTGNVTRIGNMFSGCLSLTDLAGLECWDTSKVTNLGSTFSGCSGLTDLSSIEDWDTSSVTSLSSTFYNCSSLIDLIGIQKWDTSKVSNMNSMFYRCRRLTDLDLSI